MPIDPGELDKRIKIYRNYPDTNALNEAVEDWRFVTEVWARRTAITDGERARASEVAATMTQRFLIRWSPTVADMDPTWRIVFKGRAYNIVAVKEPDEYERNEALEITAGTRAEMPDVPL